MRLPMMGTQGPVLVPVNRCLSTPVSTAQAWVMTVDLIKNTAMSGTPGFL